MPKHKVDSQPVAILSQTDSLFWVMVASIAILCMAVILIWYCMPASASGKTVGTSPRQIVSIENNIVILDGGNHLRLSASECQLLDVGCTYIISTSRQSGRDVLVSYQKISCP